MKRGDCLDPGYRIRRERAIRLSHQLGFSWNNVQFTPGDLAKGMKVEEEHADVTRCDPVLTAKIALAHLKEDPKYYQKLARMEGGQCG